TLARALGKLRRVPWVEPEAFAHLDLELARRLPAQVAHKRRAVPMKWLKPEGPGGEVLVAFESPPDLDGLDELSFILGARIVPGIAPQELVDDALDRMFPVPRPKAYRVVDLDPHAPLGGVEDNQEQVLRECRAELETHPEGCVLLVDGEHWRALTARRPVLDYVVEYVRRRHDASGQVTVRERRSRHLLAHFTGRGRPVAGKEPPGVNQGVLDELFSQRIHGARGGKSAPGAVASPGVMVRPPPSSGGWGAPMPSFGPPTPSVPTLLGTVPPPTVDMALHELPVRARDVPREGSTVWVGPAPVPGNGHPASAAWTTPPVPPAALPKTLPPPPPPRSVVDVPAPPEDGDSEAWFAEPGSDLDAQGGALGPDDLMLDADAEAGAPAPGFADSESALAQAAVEQETLPAASDEGARGAARSEVQVPEAGRSDAAPWAPAPEARFIVASDPETRQGTAPELPPLAGPEAASVVTPAPVR
ncbi:MAG: hypothetical protein KC933_40420, partial [Myxococcales bacterium]|nr:hypothetical protein [Myxococcales bacterium]